MSVHTFDRDGVSLVCEEVGAGEPAFVFVHGWTCNRTHWDPQVAHFSRRHRVVTVDLRGHGASDAPEQVYATPAFADDLAWLCGRLGVSDAVLVGHSMGATVVLEAATRFAGLARAAVLVDAAPIAMSREMAAATDEAQASMSGADVVAARSAIVEQVTTGFEGDPELGARIRQEMRATPEHVAVSCLLNLGRWDGAETARQCTVPVLHIGADDPMNDAAALRALNPRLRTGQTVGGGHFNHLQVPEQVNAMIERFVAGLARS